MKMVLNWNRQNVTLIELLIVMIIIAILSVVIFVSMTAEINDANRTNLAERKAKINTAVGRWVVRQTLANSRILGEDISGKLTANNGSIIKLAAKKLLKTDLVDRVIEKFDGDRNGVITPREAAKISPQEVLGLARKYVGIVRSSGIKPDAKIAEDKEFLARLSRVLNSMVLPPKDNDNRNSRKSKKNQKGKRIF